MNSKLMNNFFLKEEHGNKCKDAYNTFIKMINNEQQLNTFFERVHLIILPRGIKGINIRYLHIFINIGNYTFNYVFSFDKQSNSFSKRMSPLLAMIFLFLY